VKFPADIEPLVVEEIPLDQTADEDQRSVAGPHRRIGLVLAGLAFVVVAFVVVAFVVVTFVVIDRGSRSSEDGATIAPVPTSKVDLRVTPTATVGVVPSPSTAATSTSVPRPTVIPQTSVVAVLGTQTMTVMIPQLDVPATTRVMPDGEVRLVTGEPWSIVARQTGCAADLVARNVRNAKGLLQIRRAANRVVLCDPDAQIQLVLESTDGVANAMIDAVGILTVEPTPVDRGPYDW